MAEISREIAPWRLSLNLTDDKSTLVQVMAWCRQATRHYLNQCWPRSMSPYDITRPQWVNINHLAFSQQSCCFLKFPLTWFNHIPHKIIQILMTCVISYHFLQYQHHKWPSLSVTGCCPHCHGNGLTNGPRSTAAVWSETERAHHPWDQQTRTWSADEARDEEEWRVPVSGGFFDGSFSFIN